MRTKNFRTTKVCPRCSEKCELTETKCPDCGLVFSRLEMGSNKLARKNLLKGERDAVVYVRSFPNDIKRYKVILIAAFLGIFGAHNLYVGKYWKGVYMFLCGILAVASVVFSYATTFVSIAAIPVGIMTFMWLFDLVDLCMGRFKVPISIDPRITDIEPKKEGK